VEEHATGSEGGGAAAPAPDPRQMLDELYAQLRRVAGAQMAGERRHHTLQATALVHEAYLRLQRRASLSVSDQGRWLAAAADEMRRILVDHARARGAIKRGRGLSRADVELDGLAGVAETTDSASLVALDAAFARLQETDARAADVVRLRFFLGLSVDETADGLGLSRRSVLRDWEFARAFLLAHIVPAD
jgi:RNA polymerase sigma-70 factor (ECF subfamily)